MIFGPPGSTFPCLLVQLQHQGLFAKSSQKLTKVCAVSVCVCVAKASRNTELGAHGVVRMSLSKFLWHDRRCAHHYQHNEMSWCVGSLISGSKGTLGSRVDSRNVTARKPFGYLSSKKAVRDFWNKSSYFWGVRRKSEEVKALATPAAHRGVPIKR